MLQIDFATRKNGQKSFGPRRLKFLHCPTEPKLNLKIIVHTPEHILNTNDTMAE